MEDISETVSNKIEETKRLLDKIIDEIPGYVIAGYTEEEALRLALDVLENVQTEIKARYGK